MSITVSQPTTIANPAPISPAPSRVEGAIRQASQKTGIDFGYLLAQAKVESSLDADAQAKTSSASGLYQFVEKTWLDVMRRHGDAHGFGHFASQITGGAGSPRVADTAMRETILDLRNDPAAASLMAGALAQDNHAALSGVLGRAPDSAELYAAHFLGAGGAGRFLTALEQRPDAPAAAEFARAAGANPAIFMEPGGRARSFAEVMGVLRGKIDGAMADGGPAWSASGATPAMPMQRVNVQAAPAALPRSLPSIAARPTPAAQPPMSDLLQQNILADAGTATSNASDHTRRAYERLRAFGL
ncbi:transglycosylase SLT domain-containing protein [Qipengyuania sp. DGS5-3]|uniref:transglycosylase SLT domain-containing protein n=1 Tax=Qipengyuania sp. DGS5-3 TaxID=3349632 RepID=UPI0036D359EB